MLNTLILCPPRTAAVSCASLYLSQAGYPTTELPSPDVTHLLLPVPSFSGGTDYLDDLLPHCPPNLIIAGGNLQPLAHTPYRTVDFLKDPYYLTANAAITSRCAIEILKKHIPISGSSILIAGWGRIGKILAQSLRSSGANVTVAARKDSDLALLEALGHQAVSTSFRDCDLSTFHAVINTIPAMILPQLHCNPSCVALELASVPGMAGGHIISARGLPNAMAPEDSGKLIAETMIRLAL